MSRVNNAENGTERTVTTAETSTTVETVTTAETAAADTIETLAAKIASAPGKWVLFLGNGVSVTDGNVRRRILSELAREVCEAASAAGAAKKIRQAVWKNDFAELSDALFGEVWDGATLLDVDRTRNIRLREKYAKQLRGRGEINIRAANEKLHLRELFSAFCGKLLAACQDSILLTACQDESVEAFWEYENSLPADTIVHTPQTIPDSAGWSRWLHTEEGAAYPQSRDESLSDNMVLVKLFGSRGSPAGMLLSKTDVESVYLQEEKRENAPPMDRDSDNTLRFLEKVFDSRNILFIGVNLKDDWLLEAADGIWTLLKKSPPPPVERYAILSEGLDTDAYHIHPIDGGSGALKELSEQLRNTVAAGTDYPAGNAREEETPLEDKEKILELFWRFYTRRPRKPFMQEEKSSTQAGVYNTYRMEYDVLKNDILGFQEQGGVPRTWSPKSVRQLAIAANNFSDFYDLRDAMDLEQTAEGEPYESRLPRLLSSRFSKKSLLLYQLLRRYESGFPLGFLRLLPKDEDGVSWRRAGIQLANSGVYVQRHGKHRLYERLHYADCVMRTAGQSLFQAKICREIDAIGLHSMYSYLYPFHNVEIAGSSEIKEETVNKYFTKMFRTLYDILRNKSEEYQQIYSLLQTELPAIVKMMRTLPDEHLEWQPGLLYYLLLESRVSVDRENLLDYCGELEEKCNRLEEQDTGKPNLRLFGEKLMLLQAKALINSQSFDIKEQQAAAKNCEEVELAVSEAHKNKTYWSDKILSKIPSEIFRHRIRACFLKSMIQGRMSTIYEIERCKKDPQECTEQRSSLRSKQRSLLDSMKDSLTAAQDIIEDREKALGKQYQELRSELARLWGECYFKRSQYHGENRRFDGEDSWTHEESFYQKSEEEYTEALKYYDSSRDRYWIQRADALRSIGDMYCQWIRSVNEAPEERLSEDKGRKELTEKCYKSLIKAYVLYRGHSDLHGIANVLQSMGQAEDHNQEKEANELRRTRLCYYKASVDLHRHLGDAWSYSVVNSFLEGKIIELEESEKK